MPASTTLPFGFSDDRWTSNAQVHLWANLPRLPTRLHFNKKDEWAIFEGQNIPCFVIAIWRAQSQSTGSTLTLCYWILGLEELSSRDRIILKSNRWLYNRTFYYYLCKNTVWLCIFVHRCELKFTFFVHSNWGLITERTPFGTGEWVHKCKWEYFLLFEISAEGKTEMRALQETPMEALLKRWVLYNLDGPGASCFFTNGVATGNPVRSRVLWMTIQQKVTNTDPELSHLRVVHPIQIILSYQCLFLIASAVL